MPEPTALDVAERRRRWVITVTLAEAVGYLAPASAGILSARAGVEGVPQVALLTAAGCVEGFCLGAGQAWAFPLPGRRLRYAGWSALGAGMVWLCVMSLPLLFARAQWPLPVAVGLGFGAAVLGLLSIGTAQWMELRHHWPTARRWIGWTALAWVCALPLSFAPSPFVDETTPLPVHFVLWGGAGLAMAWVMAVITWQGVRRLGLPPAR